MSLHAVSAVEKVDGVSKLFKDSFEERKKAIIKGAKEKLREV